MITVVCFWWQSTHKGVVLPSQKVTTYDESWVYKLKNSIDRNYSKPYRFVCITDQQNKLQNVETYPLWDDYRELGGCFTRLKLFSHDMKNIFGDRIIAIDLDCVITGNIDHIFDRTEEFVIHKYSTKERDQKYNGSMFLMTAGARSKVWTTFGTHAPAIIKACSHNVIGSDQAWIRISLGPDEARFTEEDGCYDIKHSPEMKNTLPQNASMVFFSGPRDPMTEMNKHPWIKDCWK